MNHVPDLFDIVTGVLLFVIALPIGVYLTAATFSVIDQVPRWPAALRIAGVLTVSAVLLLIFGSHRVGILLSAYLFTAVCYTAGYYLLRTVLTANNTPDSKSATVD